MDGAFLADRQFAKQPAVRRRDHWHFLEGQIETFLLFSVKIQIWWKINFASIQILMNQLLSLQLDHNGICKYLQKVFMK